MGGLNIMTDLKELKTIADKALSNLNVDEKLKIKTMQGLKRKRAPWIKTALIPAACAGAILIGIVVCTGVLSPGGKQASSAGAGSAGSTGISTMAAGTGVTTPDSTFSGGQVLESWKVQTMEDAKKYWGGSALVPSYIPEGYTLKEIDAAGPTASNAISMIMEFDLNGCSFLITQDKGVTKKMNPENSRKLEINGLEGFVDSTKFDNGETTIYSTTVRWYNGDSMYAVQGSISEEEAIKVAESLK
jgi:hypothetical protein